MILLQAAMGLGILLTAVFSVLIFVVLPIGAILHFIRQYQGLSAKGVHLGIKEKFTLALQSLLNSTGLIFIIGGIILIVLYLTIDLTMS